MQNFKQGLAALFLAVGVSFSPGSFAQSNSNDTAVQVSNVDQDAEQVVAIAQAAQQNEAINDAVLGNEALQDTLAIPDIGVASAEGDTQVGNHTNVATAEPRQSTAQAVESDKLILNSPVVDQANIFSPQEKQILSQKLRQIYNQGLAQAALVTVPTTNGMSIFQYSMQVADKWQLGNKDTDDGLLILVAVNDRNIYILSGYGLEGVLPDAALKRIIDEDITPYFKQGDYAGGLMQGIHKIETRLQKDPEILAQSDALAKERSQAQMSNADAPSLFGTFLIALIFGLFLTSIFGRILGSLMATGGFVVLSLSSGSGLIVTLFMAVFLWLFLVSRGGGSNSGRGGRGGGGGVVFFPGGGFGGGGGGGFGGGGFGGGGFGGGGGGFGGGGAGGSW